MVKIRDIDPMTMQVLRFKFEQVADESAFTVQRTARSLTIKEIKDMSSAVFDRDGNTIGQSHHMPLFTASFEMLMDILTSRFDESNVEEGDVILVNDPYQAGQHVMDMYAISPIFYEGEIVNWAGSVAHMSDLGGSVEGGVAGGLREVYEEGIRIPFMKLFKNYERNEEVQELIGINSRQPKRTLGDLNAQAAGNFTAQERFSEIYEKYDKEEVQACSKELLNVSERRMRDAISEIPDGDYSGKAFIDDDGRGTFDIPVQTNVEVAGDEVTVDFEGTSEQVEGNINIPRGGTDATVYYVIIVIADPDVIKNSGVYRPIHVNAREGLLVNPKSPAGVAARNNSTRKIVQALMKAFSEAFPEKVTAGHNAEVANCNFAWVKGEERGIYKEIQSGGAGAMHNKDGKDGQDCHIARFRNTPVESIEMENPARVLTYEFIKDSGGAGKYRGALAPRRDVKILADKARFVRYADSQRHAPFGLFGGQPGQPGKFLLIRDGEEKQLHSKGVDELEQGDIVSLRFPAGGGFYDPKERPLDLVQKDLTEGKISKEAAEEVYKTVVEDDLKINVEKSKNLREKLKEEEK